MKYPKSKNNKPSKKYVKQFLDNLEYIQDEVFAGGTIEYNSNADLAMLMGIEYNDEKIDRAIKMLENDRCIMTGLITYSYPYIRFIDIIPF